MGMWKYDEFDVIIAVLLIFMGLFITGLSVISITDEQERIKVFANVGVAIMALGTAAFFFVRTMQNTNK